MVIICTASLLPSGHSDSAGVTVAFFSHSEFAIAYSSIIAVHGFRCFIDLYNMFVVVAIVVVVIVVYSRRPHPHRPRHHRITFVAAHPFRSAEFIILLFNRFAHSAGPG